MSDPSKLHVPLLDEKNFSLWSRLIESATKSIFGFHILDEPTFVEPEVPDASKFDNGEESAEYKKKFKEYKTYFMVQNMVLSSISSECLYLINDCKTPGLMFVALREHFCPTSGSNVVRLRGHFYRTSLAQYSSMAKFVDGINMQAAAINAISEKINKEAKKVVYPLVADMEKLTVLLSGLGDDYDVTREILETSPDMTYELACKHLKEKDHSNSTSSSSPSAVSLSSASSYEHANAASTYNQ